MKNASKLTVYKGNKQKWEITIFYLKRLPEFVEGVKLGDSKLSVVMFLS